MRAVSLLFGAAVVTASFVSAVPSVRAQTQSGQLAETQCQIVEIAIFTDRVHVKCTVNPIGAALMVQTGQTPISYLAVATNSPMSAGFIQLATVARAANKPLAITFTPGSAAQNPPGCQAADCRAVLQARIVY